MQQTVLCFGDSNTHGTCPIPVRGQRDRLPPDLRWPGQMAARLGPGWHVIEEGHPGRTTVHDDPVEGEHRNALRVLPALLESHRPLDAVVVMLGTNDLKARFAVTPADIALSVDRLLGLILAAGVGRGVGPGGAAGVPRLLVVAPPPIVETGWLGEHFTGGEAKSCALAPHLAAIAAARGAGFVDAGGLIAVSPVDGVHFDAPAHAVLGAAIARALLAGADT